MALAHVNYFKYPPTTWDPIKNMGPAIVLPKQFKSLKVTHTLFFEFLKVNDGRNKNHVVIRVLFETAGDKDDYKGARISMDPADEAFDVVDASEDNYLYPEDMAPGYAYHPGQLNVKLLTYATQSISAQHAQGFDILPGDLTLGALVDIIIGSNMFQFIFNLYMKPDGLGVWKGCRDFMFQLYLLLVRHGIISATDEAGKTFHDSVACFYKDEEVRPQPIDKGEFVCFARVDDKETVGTVYDPLVDAVPHADGEQ